MQPSAMHENNPKELWGCFQMKNNQFSAGNIRQAKWLSSCFRNICLLPSASANHRKGSEQSGKCRQHQHRADRGIIRGSRVSRRSRCSRCPARRDRLRHCHIRICDTVTVGIHITIARRRRRCCVGRSLRTGGCTAARRIAVRSAVRIRTVTGHIVIIITGVRASGRIHG